MNKKTAGLFLDISKAFDTVNHSILINKLYRFGFRGPVLKWVTSYLNNRQQCVRINKTLSEFAIVSLGVPQGSVLGPILFLIYIDSLLKVEFNGKIVAFADDIALSYSAGSYNNLISNIEDDIIKLRFWYNQHEMVISSKSKFLVFNIKNDSSCSVVIPSEVVSHCLLCTGGNCSVRCVKVASVKTFKYLGIVLDHRLKFDIHVEQVRNKLINVIRIFYLVRELCPLAVRKSMYYSFFHSRLEYGITLWGGGYFCNVEPLIILQKFAVRVIYFKNKFYSSLPLFREANILPLRYLFVYKVLKFFRNSRDFNSIVYSTCRKGRVLNNCSVPFSRKEICLRSFFFIAPYFFNLVPNEITCFKSVKKFQSMLRYKLFEVENMEIFINRQIVARSF